MAAFVLAKYYWVDGLVTLALGFLVLVGLVAGGRPPQAGSFWAALVMGSGLGLFMNSELLTKFKK